MFTALRHNLGHFLGRLRLARKIQLLLLLIILPLLALFVALLLNIYSYNQQYDKIISNAAEAAKFSIDFKEDFDYQIYLVIAGHSTIDEQAPYSTIDEARAITQDLIDNTDLYENKQRAQNIMKLFNNLEKYVKEIEHNKEVGGHYYDNIAIWENDVQTITALIQSDVYEYSYYVTKEMEAVREEVSFALGKITLVSTILFAAMTFIAVVLSFVIPNSIAKPIVHLNDVTSQVAKLLQPIGSMIEVTKQISKNELNQPAQSDDEIGKLSNSYNEMANAVFTLVNNLEEKVNERTIDLQTAKDALEESKDKLQLILDSTVEAIFGIDKNGNCTFCNASCIRMLRYESQDELLGQNMHWLIHHSRKNGSPISIEECDINRTIMTGIGTQSDNEVFWRADGTCFDTVYYSYPQYKNGEMVGAVVTFMDNTERKKAEEHIRFLSYHDSLTGLYNRMYFEDALKSINTKDNIPISIIFGDLNGLKLTNDIFGHAAGDELIKKSAEILKKVCRDEDIVARVGGDEFIILLPNTDEKDAQSIIQRVQNEFAQAKLSAIKCSMSMGYDTKASWDIAIERTLENAENSMYKEKTNTRKAVNEQMIKTIVDTLHERSPEERNHAVAVSLLAQTLGKELGLSEDEIKTLQKAGFLHDIGKVVEGDSNVNAYEKIDESQRIHQHAVVGFRILNLFDDTLDIANIVYSHHERWDGNGYPKGLKSQSIPSLARIIAIAENYDWMVRERAINADEALNEISAHAGTKFDPELVKVFTRMMKREPL